MNRPRNQQGYVLLLVLWAMVVLSVIAARSLDMLSDAQLNAIKASDTIAAERDEQTTLAHLLFLLGRQSGGIRGLPTGLGHILVDGTVYVGAGDIRFNIIDQHALLNLNTLNRRQAEGLVAQLNLSISARHLLAQIEDYIDLNDWPEAGGAERMQYQSQGKVGPANHLFRTPAELLLLPALNDIAEIQNLSTLAPKLTTLGTGRVNINSADISHIQSLDSMAGVNLAPIVSRREQNSPVAGLPDLKRVLSLPSNWPLDYNDVSFGLSRYVRINLWHQHSASLTEYNLINTPNKQHPWRIVYVRKLPIPEQWSAEPGDSRFRQVIQIESDGTEG